MEIKAKCQSCDAKYRLPEKAAGKVFKCKQCGETVKVPTPVATADEPEMTLDGMTTPDGDPLMQFPIGFSHTPRKKQSLPIKPIAIGGGALVVLVVLGVVVAGMFGGKENPEDQASRTGLEFNPNESTDGTQLSADYEWEPPARPDRPNRPPGFHGDPRDTPPWEREPIDGNPQTPETDNGPEVDNPPRQENEQPDASDNDAAPNVPRTAPSTARQQRSWQADQTGFPRSPEKRQLTIEADPIDPIGPWNVTPTAPDEKALWKPRPDLELNINDRTMQDVIIPATHSRFIAVGDNSNSKGRRIIVDLSRGNAVWDLQGDYDDNGGAYLSPDGNILLFASGSDEFTPAFASRRTRGKAMEAAVALTGARYAWRGFVSNTLAVFLHQDEEEDPVQATAVDAETGQVKWQTELIGAEPKDQHCAISSTGKYLAVPALQDGKRMVLMLDTASGEIAGRLALPGDIQNNIYRLAFSVDGQHLAGQLGASLYLWDMATGKLSGQSVHKDRTYPKTLSIDRNFKFYMVDNQSTIAASGGIYHYYIDALTGKQVLSPPKIVFARNRFHLAHDKRHLFGDAYLIYQKAINSKNRRQANTLTIFRLGEDTIARGVAAVRGGGHHDEADLPPLEETFYYPARTDYLSSDPSKPYDAWPIELEPSVGQPTPPNMQYKMRQVNLEQGRSIFPYAFTQYGPLLSKNGLQLAFNTSTNSHCILDHKNISQTMLPKVSPRLKPRALSQDEQYGYYTAGAYRVVKIKLDTQEVVGNWRLRPDPKTFGKYEANTTHRITDIYEANENRLWVAQQSHPNGVRGCLIATDTNQLLLAGGKLSEQRIATTPNGRYLLNRMGYFTNDQIAVIDSQQGKAIGQLRIGDGSPKAYRISPEGTRVAVIVEHELIHYLVVVDLSNNAIIARNPVPEGKVIKWASEGRVLIDNQWLAEIDTGRFIWKYDIGRDKNFEFVDPMNNIIQRMVKATGELAKRTGSVQKQFPFISEAMEQMIAANPETTSKASLAIGPGSRVRISVSGHKADELQQNLASQIENAGLILDDNAEFTIQRRVEQTAKPREFFAGGQPVTVNEYEVKTTFEWIAKDGGVMWSTTINSSSKIQGVIATFRQQEGESSQAALQRKIDEDLQQRSISSWKIPTRLPWHGDVQVLGKTTWNPESQEMEILVKSE